MKYRTACIEYVKATDEVKRLTREIGKALEHCPGAGRPEDAPYTHLQLAYRSDFYSDAGEYLEEICPHCLRAHQLIQDRKQARQRLGVAKRRLSLLGRAAINEKMQCDGTKTCPVNGCHHKETHGLRHDCRARCIVQGSKGHKCVEVKA